MLRYKVTLTIFLVLLITVGLLNYLFSISLLYLLIPIVLYISTLIIASFVVNSQFYVHTICAKANTNNEIAITFDDGPNKEITPKILDILHKNNVLATFFCVGKRVIENKDVLLQIHQAGHLIGNHTYSHSKWFDLFSARKMANEFDNTNKSIFQIIGTKPVYFRPPYGVTNPTMKRPLRNFNFISIGWSLRSLDTVIKSKENVIERVVKKVKSGDIILFHDTVPHTPQIIDVFITTVISKGFKIVRIDDLINKKAYE
ncbi:MAG: hypothetical protein AUJ97_00965 [Bacteroidetes bacterium CG2_30_32_10]|nr:MAG: hypothetical protein AUJ97_00965 [Bacteroidetes bacterium CG2_30_32_10]